MQRLRRTGQKLPSRHVRFTAVMNAQQQRRMMLVYNLPKIKAVIIAVQRGQEALMNPPPLIEELLMIKRRVIFFKIKLLESLS